MIRCVIRTCGLAAALLVFSAFGASAFSWSDMTPAVISGISLDKPLQANVLDYTLTLGSSPTIILSGQTFQIDWVQAFYVVAGGPDARFTAAAGSGPPRWSWDSKTAGGQVSGWIGTGNTRLLCGQSAEFSFSAFDPAGCFLMPAYHIGYHDGGKAVTGWYVSQPPPSGRGGGGPDLPEWPPVILAAGGLSAALRWVGRARQRVSAR